MKCPKCGSELRQLPKNPKVFYCENCKKYFKNDLWQESTDYQASPTPPAPSSPPKSRSNNIYFLILGICGALLVGILVFFIGMMLAPIPEGTTLNETQDPAAKNTITETGIEASTDTVRPTKSQTETPQKEILTIGDSDDNGEISVTFLSAQTFTGDDYTQPDPGNVFLVLEFEIENISDSSMTVSTLWDFEAYCDDYHCDQDFSGYFLEDIQVLGTLDGDIAPGKKIKGAITYQVPEDFKNFEIYISSDGFFSDKIGFELSE